MDHARLLVDIGGTNTRCALQQAGAPPKLIRASKNRRFPGIVAVLRNYLDDLPADMRPRSGALAVAGPIAEETITLLKNKDGLLPLPKDSRILLTCAGA